MNEQTFLSLMFEKFNLSDFSIEVQTPKYKAGLISNIDFYKLWQHVENNCRSMPTVIELNKIVKNRHFMITRSPVLAHIDEIKRTPPINFANISDDFRQKLIEFHKKMEIKTKIKELQNAG